MLRRSLRCQHSNLRPKVISSLSSSLRYVFFLGLYLENEPSFIYHFDFLIASLFRTNCNGSSPSCVLVQVRDGRCSSNPSSSSHSAQTHFWASPFSQQTQTYASLDAPSCLLPQGARTERRTEASEARQFRHRRALSCRGIEAFDSSFSALTRH